jgi:hypothetical protein
MSPSKKLGAPACDAAAAPSAPPSSKRVCRKGIRSASENASSAAKMDVAKTDRRKNPRYGLRYWTIRRYCFTAAVE